MATNNPYALSFDGVDDNVDLNNVDLSLFDGTNDFTLEFWFKTPTSSELNDYNTMFHISNNDTEIQFKAVNNTNNNFVFQWREGSNWNSIVLLEGWDNETIYHLSIVKEGGEIRGYIDGILKASTNINEISNEFSSGSYLMKNSYSDEYMPGIIDELRIWNVARTKTEIQDNMHRKLATGEQNLQIYYRCDDNSDVTTLVDVAGNNDALITGAIYTVSEIDLELPPVDLQANDITNISASSATLNGEIVSLGQETQLDVAFQYSPDPEFATNIQQTPYQTISSPQSISADVSGLDTSTGYYVRMTAEGS